MLDAGCSEAEIPSLAGLGHHEEIPNSHYSETFEKCSISFKIKAHEDFNRRNMLNILRIKIQNATQRLGERGRFSKVSRDRQACYCYLVAIDDIIVKS